MYFLKGCPRCGGDVYEGSDIYATYLACIQCGHYASDDETEALRSERAGPPAALIQRAADQGLGTMAG